MEISDQICILASFTSPPSREMVSGAQNVRQDLQIVRQDLQKLSRMYNLYFCTKSNYRRFPNQRL